MDPSPTPQQSQESPASLMNFILLGSGNIVGAVPRGMGWETLGLLFSVVAL